MCIRDRHHTAVRTFENKRVIIPNSKMNSAIIENADYADSKVCVFLTVGITYESDLKKAKELLAREVRKQPAFLDIRTEQQKKDGVPDVPVVVLELADSAVVLRASLWAKDNATAFALKCAVLEGIKLTYDEMCIRDRKSGFFCPSGNLPCAAPAESKPHV